MSVTQAIAAAVFLCCCLMMLAGLPRNLDQPWLVGGGFGVGIQAVGWFVLVTLEPNAFVH